MASEHFGWRLQAYWKAQRLWEAWSHSIKPRGVEADVAMWHSEPTSGSQAGPLVDSACSSYSQEARFCNDSVASKIQSKTAYETRPCHWSSPHAHRGTMVAARVRFVLLPLAFAHAGAPAPDACSLARQPLVFCPSRLRP